jgi:class 3 adenylate cyclase
VRAVADMALAMLDVASSHRDGLGLRIGIDTGPVVAGVIGRRKFIYDLWGDTVNTASRMESHGVRGEIQVTERVVAALADGYMLEPRGSVEIKGKGRHADVVPPPGGRRPRFPLTTRHPLPDQGAPRGNLHSRIAAPPLPSLVPPGMVSDRSPHL